MGQPEVTVAEALDIIDSLFKAAADAQGVYNPVAIAALHHARRALAENADLRAALARAEQTAAETLVPAIRDHAPLHQHECGYIEELTPEDLADGFPCSWCNKAERFWWPLYRKVTQALAADAPAAPPNLAVSSRQLADAPAAADQPCGSCNGDRWVDDENWQPEDYERAQGPVIGSGRIPCGLCNHGGWSVPEEKPC